MNVAASISEDHGISVLSDNDVQVYSVGISTGGVAEIRMAALHPKRQIIATTIDEEGAGFARDYIAQKNLETQIEVKIEDIAELLPYPAAFFDYVYARLVLHYLPKDKLINALTELHRVIKPGGKIFVVVRSTKCPDATRPEATFNPETHLTTCSDVDKETGKTHSYSRYFHTLRSISGYVKQAGFAISHSKSYDEYLFVDFMRTKQAPHKDNVIELLAKK